MSARRVIGTLIVGALFLGVLFWFLMTSGCNDFHITHHVEVHSGPAPTPTPQIDGYQQMNDRTEAR